MKKTIPLLIFFAALLSVAVETGAEALGAPILIEQLREDVFHQTLRDEEVYRRYIDYSAELDDLSDSLDEKERLYYRSLLEYWMGRAYQSFDSRETVLNHHRDVQKGRYLRLKQYYSALDQAVFHYDASLKAIEAYLKLEKDSEGLRQYSEVQGQMILLRPPGYALKNGMSVKRTLKKSLKLDPENLKSRIMDGASDIYTPAAYGGDPDKGMDKLLEIKSSPECDREDLFNIYTGLAYGLIISSRASEAGDWLDKAGEIYPGNVYLNGLYGLAEEGESRER